MKRIVVNGLFLTQQVTGIQRFAFEIIQELDKLIKKNTWEILVPDLEISYPVFENIRLVRYGKSQGIKWEQWELPRYLREKNACGLHLCNTVPWLFPRGIAVVHDISYKVNPQFFVTGRDRMSALWHRAHYWVISRFAERIICVSQFSKQELERVYHVPGQQVAVVYNAWQHMQHVQEEKTILAQKDYIQNGNYYFAMATLAKNKNFDWIIRTAYRHPEEHFLVAGKGDFKNAYPDAPTNVHFLGYVSDGEAKALMHHCKAFLFPTFYEGFGIPPLEAVACGARHIIISDTACMHEIYGEFASYVNPYEAGLPQKLVDASDILEKYAWSASARELLAVIDEANAK